MTELAVSKRAPGRQLAPLLALVLCTLLFVGACGDDDGGDSSPTPGDDTAQPTASPGDGTAAPVTFPESLDACNLMRTDELVRLLGSDPVGESIGELSDNMSSICAWSGNQEGEFSSVGLSITTSPTAFQDLKQDPEYERLDGVGEEAYWQPNLIEGSPLPTANMIVRNGLYYIQLFASGPLDGDEARDELSSTLRRLLQDLP